MAWSKNDNFSLVFQLFISLQITALHGEAVAPEARPGYCVVRLDNFGVVCSAVPSFADYSLTVRPNHED